MIPTRTYVGFCLLQSIAMFIFIVGYFQAPQSLKNQSTITNPFLNRTDWFVPEFSRIVLVVADVDRQVLSSYVSSRSNYHTEYTIDTQIYLERKDLFEVIMIGINPFSLLQYGLVDLNRWDSIPNQLHRKARKMYISSDNNYDENFVKPFKYLKFDHFVHDIPEFLVNTDNLGLLYMDNVKSTAQEIIDAAERVWKQENSTNDTTLFLVYSPPTQPTLMGPDVPQEGPLWFLSPNKFLGATIKYQFRQQSYPIDSLASTLACLLNIPIPLQNHGMILPGAYFKEKNEINETLIDTPELVQLYDQVMNMEQLSIHLYLLDKDNPLFRSQKEIKSHLEYMLEQAVANPNSTLIPEMIRDTRKESQKINLWLNSEISGNPYVMIIGLILMAVSIWLFSIRARPNEEMILGTIDVIIFVIVVVIAATHRGYQLGLTSLIVIGFVVKRVERLVIDKKLGILLQLLAVTYYLNFPHNLLSTLIWLAVLGQLLYLFTILLRGVWGYMMTKESAGGFLYLQCCGGLTLLSYLTIPYIQPIALTLSLVFSILLFTQEFIRFMNLNGRILLFLLLSAGYMAQYMPISLIGIIAALTKLEVQLLKKHGTPCPLVIFFLVYEASLYQIPMIPHITEYTAYLVQSYMVLLYWLLGQFMEQVYSEQSSSIAVKKTMAVWGTSVQEVLANHALPVGSSLHKILISWSLMILCNWAGIFVNEVFQLDTTPFYQGQEYYYLQDGLALHFFQLVVILLTIKISQDKVIELSVDDGGIQHTVPDVDYSSEMTDIQL